MGFLSNNNKKIEEYEKAKEKRKLQKKRLEERKEREKLAKSEKKLAEAKRIKKEELKKESQAKQKRIEDARKQERIRLEQEEREEDIRRAIKESNEKKQEDRRKEKIAREQREKIRKDEEKRVGEKREIEEKILKEKEKIVTETSRIKKEKEISQKLIKFYKNNILQFKNKLKDIERKDKERLAKNKKVLKKIASKERLYDPSIIKSISDEVSLRIFYDLDKKQKAYFKFTDFINRIEIREEEMKEEMKIDQNIVNLSIRWTPGDEYRIETLNAGGVMDHHPFDAPGYNLRIGITVEEQYLVKKIKSLIRGSFPKMSAMDGKLGISAFLEDQKNEEEYARRIIQKITRKICGEFEELGEVLIEKY